MSLPCLTRQSIAKDYRVKPDNDTLGLFGSYKSFDAARGLSPLSKQTSRKNLFCDVELKENHVAVLHDVFFSFLPIFSSRLNRRLSAKRA